MNNLLLPQILADFTARFSPAVYNTHKPGGGDSNATGECQVEREPRGFKSLGGDARLMPVTYDRQCADTDASAATLDPATQTLAPSVAPANLISPAVSVPVRDRTHRVGEGTRCPSPVAIEAGAETTGLSNSEALALLRLGLEDDLHDLGGGVEKSHETRWQSGKDTPDAIPRRETEPSALRKISGDEVRPRQSCEDSVSPAQIIPYLDRSVTIEIERQGRAFDVVVEVKSAYRGKNPDAHPNDPAYDGDVVELGGAWCLYDVELGVPVLAEPKHNGATATKPCAYGDADGEVQEGTNIKPADLSEQDSCGTQLLLFRAGQPITLTAQEQAQAEQTYLEG